MHRTAQHIALYRKPGRYAGWPANYGIWSWQEEIVVGFTLGFYDANNGGFHTADRNRPFLSMQARSVNGGFSWQVESFPGRTPGGLGLSADEHVNSTLKIAHALDGQDGPTSCLGGIDFTHPNFAMMCARSGLGEGTRSFFYYSTDRCHSWQGPFWLPDYGQKGIEARTDYLVNNDHTCTLFLTATKRNGQEGRVFCARSTDGGAHFEMLSFIGEEPQGFAIMPASLRLPSGQMLVARRLRTPPRGNGGADDWIDFYRSDDDGQNWQSLGAPIGPIGPGGNPATLTALADGRIALAYGFRDAPYGLRARISHDEGRHWGEERILRDDGGCGDLGYPRTVLLPVGHLLSTYYYNDTPDGERYIAATRWKP